MKIREDDTCVHVEFEMGQRMICGTITKKALEWLAPETPEQRQEILEAVAMQARLETLKWAWRKAHGKGPGG